MASVSGLRAKHRAEVRREILRSIRLLVAHPGDVHYTQGSGRWDGIAHKKHPSKGLFPFYGDCSSTDTWLLWLGLHHYMGEKYGRPVRDLVNGTNWTGGFTGTMVRHGKPVAHDRNLMVGDQIFYGSGPTYHHVVTSIGGRRAFSHGTDSGPFLVDIDYRLDRGPTRRYI